MFWRATTFLVLGCAFLAFSVPRLRELARGGSFGPAGPYSTTDSYSAGLLKIRNGSERMLETFSALPRAGSIAVVYADGSGESFFIACLASYFAWPRDAHFIPVTSDTVARQVESINRSSFAAVVFCRVDPPAAMQPVVRIGSGLVLVPNIESPEAMTR